MTYEHRARDSTIRPFEGYPGYGAVHEVIPDTRLVDFLSDFRKMADAILNPKIEEAKAEVNDEINPIPEYVAEEEFALIDISGKDSEEEKKPNPKKLSYDPRNYYRMFNIEGMAVPVLEMDPKTKTTQFIQRLFERQDFGSVEQDARDEITRHPYVQSPSLTFNRIEGVGNSLPGMDSGLVRQKLALFPDTSEDLDFHELMAVEQEKLVKAIKGRLKQEVIPWTLNPILTFVVLKNHVTPGQYQDILCGANNLLWDIKTDGETGKVTGPIPKPLVVELDSELLVHSRSTRSKSTKKRR